MLEKLQEFLEQEAELLADFQDDLSMYAPFTKEHSKAYSLWAVQAIRVRALLEAVDLLK